VDKFIYPIPKYIIVISKPLIKNLTLINYI